MLAASLLLAVSAPDVSGKKINTDDGYLRITDIPYTQEGETDAYRLERCRLDLYYPEDKPGFATLVWFHGGGLESGSKWMRDEFRRQGFAVVDVNYRLYPGVKCPGYIEDAAMSVAWVFNHIAEYGGDPSRIYVGGHSAGGYLTLMLTLDKKYLAAYGIDADRIVKGYPVSGQVDTHFTIKKERGMNPDIPFIDDMAPIFHSRREGAPLMLITGARELELLARYEENAHLAAILRHLGHPVELFEMQGFDHGTILSPACIRIREDIKEISDKNY